MKQVPLAVAVSKWMRVDCEWARSRVGKTDDIGERSPRRGATRHANLVQAVVPTDRVIKQPLAIRVDDLGRPERVTERRIGRNERTADLSPVHEVARLEHGKNSRLRARR